MSKEPKEVKEKNEVLSELEKKYGKGIIISGDVILEQQKKIISVSPRMDMGLSGGIPEGGWILCSGLQKRGKTTLTLQMCANAQKIGKKIVYLDVEHRLKKMNLSGIKGLKTDPNSFQIITSQKGAILAAEDFLNIATDILHEVPDIFLVIDSVSSLCSSAEIIGDVTAQARNAGPKLMANFWRKNKDIVPVQNSNICMIVHLIANTSGYGAKWTEDGGVKIQYACDVKLKNRATEDWIENDKQIGIIPDWEIETSALGAPCKSVKTRIRFGLGVDSVAELMDLGIEMGFISKGGSWYNCEFAVDIPEIAELVDEDKKTKEKSCKFQGEKKLYDFLVSQPVVVSKLEQDIKSLL